MNCNAFSSFKYHIDPSDYISVSIRKMLLFHNFKKYILEGVESEASMLQMKNRKCFCTV